MEGQQHTENLYERNQHILIANIRVRYGTYIGLEGGMVSATNMHQYSVCVTVTS